jgi:RHS repeat-associated protein
MTLVDRVNRQRSLAAISRTLRSGRIAANASVPTTTYSYDANGNLIQAGGWSYMWDYLNRMLATGFNNSTTTYAYDQSGARVLQTSTTSTTYYPNKYYSLTSTKAGSNTYATSTNYIWNGDTLLATIDQPLYNGAATGTAIYRYIHPDHLGSTNAVTDQNGNLVQTLDYYPFGASRISVSTSTNEARKYIGQFFDSTTNLSYLQARYYDSARGQFVNEDPVFWESPLAQKIYDPQSLNSYNYSADNPINKLDPSGRYWFLIPAAAGVAAGVSSVAMLDYPVVMGNIQHGYPLTFGLPSWKEQVATGVSAGSTAAAVATASIFDAPAAALFAIGAIGSGGGSMMTDKAAGRSVDYSGAANTALFGGLLSLLPSNPFEKGFVRSVTAANAAKYLGYETTSNVGGSMMYNSIVGTGGTGGQSQSLTQLLSQKATISAPTSQTGGGGSCQGCSAYSYTAGQYGIGNSQGAFVGTYNFGSGVGTFNFGTGQWQK